HGPGGPLGGGAAYLAAVSGGAGRGGSVSPGGPPRRARAPPPPRHKRIEAAPRIGERPRRIGFVTPALRGAGPVGHRAPLDLAVNLQVPGGQGPALVTVGRRCRRGRGIVERVPAADRREHTVTLGRARGDPDAHPVMVVAAGFAAILDLGPVHDLHRLL